ncbi:hypothetical protein BDF14DRAFT_1853954 [Spinellus fusiger]|nr:hypothetical protein BDF14DRAFT_1853954 [Spinellus fusiger]
MNATNTHSLENESRNTQSIDLTEAEFVSSANNKLVSLLAKEAGFHSIQRSALDTLSDLMGTYLERLFHTSHTYAELGNRIKPNYHDIEESFKHSGLTMHQLEVYLEKTKTDNTLVRPAKRILRTERSLSQSVDHTLHFLPSEDEDEDDFMTDKKNTSGHDLPFYVPPNLPRFPSKHSFRQTPVYIQRPDDPQKVRALNSQQSRTVEENLKRFMSAEQHGHHQGSKTAASNATAMMPLVNYENSLQRRTRAKQSGFSDFRTNYSREAPPTLPLKRYSDGMEASKDPRTSIGPVQ